MNREQIAELEKRVLIPTYDRLPSSRCVVKAATSTTRTAKKHLDFLGGLAVNSLGYAHPEIMAAAPRLKRKRFLHVSNLIYHPYQARWRRS